MGYKLNENQRGLSRGESRYDFYVKYKKQQNFKTKVCKASAVKAVFSDYEKEVQQKIDAEEQRIIESERLEAENSERAKLPRLFDNMDRYLKEIELKRSPKMTKYTYTIFRYFKECFGDMVLTEFKLSYVNKYVIHRQKQSIQRGKARVSDRTINREIAELSTFFSWCIKNELYTKVNPCFGQKLKVNIVREVYLTSEQIAELLDKGRKEGDLIYSAILVSLSTGFRRGEVFALEYKDIDFRHSRIFLRASTTKGNKSRIVAVPDYLIEHLEEMREQAEDKQGRVFQEWDTVDWLRNAFERVWNRLSFNPLPNGTSLHFHDLRHVYAQSLRDMGIALQDIAAFCGHSSVAVTEKFYSQAGGKDAKAKVEKLAEVIPFKRVKVS